MDLILCHQTADFDALGAAVGLTRLKKGSQLILTGGANPVVRNFLALYRDELATIELRSINPERIRSITVVDTQKRSRLGKAASWLDLVNLNSLEVYDHHLDVNSDIPATWRQIEAVGATTTLIVERLQAEGIEPNAIEATTMALGIHVDTGSLTYEQTTVRDAKALAWLMEKGAKVAIVAEYAEPNLSARLQELLKEAFDRAQTNNIRGYNLTSVLLETEDFIPGLSNLAARLLEIQQSDALILGHAYSRQQRLHLTVIGRSRIPQTNLTEIFAPLGGGGHDKAASLSCPTNSPATLLQELLEKFSAQIPLPPKARDLMSSPVRTIRPETTIEQAERILFRYGHSGLSVVDERDRLVGIVSRRDLDLALHHGFSHAPVKGYMSKNLKTITPDTYLPEIESLMVTYDVGRLPVLNGEHLIGIVTRTDVLRQLHQEREQNQATLAEFPLTSCLLPSLQDRLPLSLWQLLDRAAQFAAEKGWHLYLVGGGVRDLLLCPQDRQLKLQDIDLVVDGFNRSADDGAGVKLAKALQQNYPQARLSIHGAFQTAALLWHKDPEFGNLWVDIATARTEFYPYPAANPEVEASSIRQDLYRRDFTINALAVRLTPPKEGELLDFFGGVLDLRSRLIRVLHPNSFIEDPTRIYRAVRFAVKLDCAIEPQTIEYIRYAIASGIYERLRAANKLAPALSTRLKAELEYILEASYWKQALEMLDSLGALGCLEHDFHLNREFWREIRYLERLLSRFDRDFSIERALIRLEVILGRLEAKVRLKVAHNLQLPKDTIARLENLDARVLEIETKLPNCQQPSQIVGELRRDRLPNLLLIALKSSKSSRAKIWHYLARWSHIKAPLNGKDLQAMGYKPGPKFQEILQEILNLTLDGVISDRDRAEEFLKTYR
jgi:tRNA nucleotidyltransferase (CCA-adding enzyme)